MNESLVLGIVLGMAIFSMSSCLTANSYFKHQIEMKQIECLKD